MTARGLAPALGLILIMLVAGCWGEQGSFISSKKEAVPTNVTGASTTSGLSANIAQAPPTSATATPKP